MLFFNFLSAHTVVRILFELFVISLLYVVSNTWGKMTLFVIRYNESEESAFKRVQIFVENRRILVFLGLLALLLSGYNVANCLVQGNAFREDMYVIEFLYWGILFFILAVMLPSRCFYSVKKLKTERLFADMLNYILAFLVLYVGEEQGKQVLDSICDVLNSDRFDGEFFGVFVERLSKIDGTTPYVRGKEYAKLYLAAYSDVTFNQDELPVSKISEQEIVCHGILRDAVRKSLSRSTVHVI